MHHSHTHTHTNLSMSNNPYMYMFPNHRNILMLAWLTHMNDLAPACTQHPRGASLS